jgi:hypothetical protein
MLTIFGNAQRRFCDSIRRRDFLKVGALGAGGLALNELLRRRAHGALGPASGVRRARSVIMVVLPGGPSHIDTYDLKPEAPADYRGELRPIKTNVPGFDVCELLPRQAKLADKLAVVRSFQVARDLAHGLHEVFTGFESDEIKEFPGGRALRPAFGSVVSRLRGQAGLLPPYVSLRNSYTSRAVPVAEDPAYLGAAHRPFVPSGAAVQNLALPRGVSAPRLRERRTLLAAFDTMRRDLDSRGEMSGVDAFTSRALELVTSSQVRDAFDVSLEPESVREAYGLPSAAKPTVDPQMLLQARRLVEAGVPVVTLTFGGWDHHSATGEPPIFTSLRGLLPAFDQGLAALISDLHQRGLSDDVAVVVWGEFGRTPRISNRGGRDHWPSAGFVLFSGGGLRMGQVIGGTDKHAARPTTRPIGPQQVLATLYYVLGIDPATTLADHQGRPIALLDEREPIAELV